MLDTYQYPRFAYARPPELDGAAPRRAVAVVGAGPVGLSLAIDLAQHSHPPILLDDDDTVSVGSRGVCYAKRTLEILDRLGVGQRVVDKGVTWNVSRTFFGDREVYRFNLLPEAGHRRPGMVNLQQYYLEEYLVARAREAGVELRFRHKVIGVTPRIDGVRVRVETPDGEFEFDCDWLVAADGARSPVRQMLGLDVEGRVFQDRFLIADVLMKGRRFLERPAERWFWFDPPFHRGQSCLLHRQADDVWRIDFQLGWDADPARERQPQRVIPRIKALLAHEGSEQAVFDLEWVSVYTFQCRRMANFVHGRVIFIGDAAHQVSPFGARGANSGIQDADNLAWKLALVLEGRAPARLLASYNDERRAAADENILNSTRSTDFITPKSHASHLLRDATLHLAAHAPFARRLVNSGRLSVPTYLDDSPLNTPDDDTWNCRLRPGAPLDDAPVGAHGDAGWLLEHVGGRFQLLLFDTAADPALVAALQAAPVPVEVILVAPPGTPARGGSPRLLVDVKRLAAQRLDATPGAAVLLRPDQHLCARWRRAEAGRILSAVRRATAND